MKNCFFTKNQIMLLVLILSGLFACQLENKSAKIDQVLKYCYENGILNGSVLVAEKGQILYHKTFGFLNMETQDTLRLNSPFYLASVSKQFTSMAIMMLKERGKLDYDDKLSDFFPEFPPYAEQVTIRHLMTHTSGIPDHFSLGSYKPDLTNQDVFNLLVIQDTLNFTSGDKYSYSNGGYVLLSMIVEEVAGVPFHEFLKQNIFTPLEMNYSQVYDESKPKIPFRAIGYNLFGERDDYSILTTGAGGIFSNTNDLLKWDQALYGEKLVKQETLAEAFSPYVLNNDSLTDYGFGWRIVQENSHKIVEHSGGLNGYRTFISRNLDKNQTIILLTNKGDAVRIGDISDAIANILNKKSFQLPRIPVALRMFQLIQKRGIDDAVIEYDNLKQNHEQLYDFSESQLNNLGYYLLSKKMTGDAIKIFNLNVREYPDAYNTYDSLAEAYMLDGDTARAVGNYEKSLELNPENNNATRMLIKLRTK